MRAKIVGAVASVTVLGGCVSPGTVGSIQASQVSYVSETQTLYDTCTPHYNTTFQNLPGRKAIVSGANGASSDCFWVWGAKSAAIARRDALAECRAEFSTCQLYATDRGNEQWVQRISDNGGNDAGLD